MLPMAGAVRLKEHVPRVACMHLCSLNYQAVQYTLVVHSDSFMLPPH